MGNTFKIISTATMAVSLVFSSGVFAAPAPSEDTVAEQTQETTCSTDLVHVFKCTGKAIGTGAAEIGKESNKYVIQPVYKYAVKPVGIGAEKLGKALKNGTVYVVLDIKHGRIRKIVYGTGRALKTVGTETYNVVVNIAIKKAIYEYGLKKGVYGLFLKPIGHGIYEVSLVVYKDVLTPVGHGVEAAERGVVRAVRWYVHSFDGGHGKLKAEVSQPEEISPALITEASLSLE